MCSEQLQTCSDKETPLEGLALRPRPSLWGSHAGPNWKGAFTTCSPCAPTDANAPACYRAPRWPDPELPQKNAEKIAPRPKFWNPEKIPQEYQKNTKNGHFWYFFGGIFLVFSGYLRGKLWESRISGVFFRYFWWKFRVGSSRGSVAGGGFLKPTDARR